MKHKKNTKNIVYKKYNKTLRIMKISILLIFISVFNLLAEPSYSQSEKISLKLENVNTIENVISEIERTTDYVFIYNEDVISTLRNEVDVEVTNQSLDEILNLLLKGTDLAYSLSSKQVTLYKDESKKIEANSSTIERLSVQQQTKKNITGTVVDEQGEPIIGANIIEKGTTNGTITDYNGKFSLNVDNSALLIISYIGYLDQEINMEGLTTINVVLKEDVLSIDEVVVVGYGIQKKVNLTGSVSSISGDTFESRPIVSVSNALSGQMTGVSVVQPSGEPGATSTVRIRGVGTMNNSAPMVLVDGIEANMNDVNPEDIERIDVLKDAAASAIYGTRAANGVILITTKRGKAGISKISYSGYIGKQALTYFPDYLNSYQYGSLLNIARERVGQTAAYTESELQKFKDGSEPFKYPDTDWFDIILDGSALQQSHSLRATGGTEKSRYMLSLAYLDQEGHIKTNSFNRYNLRFNLDSKITDNFNVYLSSSMVREESEKPNSRYGEDVRRIFNEAHRVPPTIPVKSENGLYSNFLGNNPAAWAKGLAGSINTVSNRIITTVGAELLIVDGLKLEGQASIKYDVNDNKNHEMAYDLDGFSHSVSNLGNYLRRNSIEIFSSFLNYEKKFGAHNLKAMLGVSRESHRYDYTGAWRQDFPSNLLTSIDAGSTGGQEATGNGYDTTLGSYFGRLNYNYQEKYLLEGSVRRDGSSKFGDGNRWGTFPSFSAGWRISEESFMKDVYFISNLKLFASWGRLGNHNIGNFLYVPKISLGNRYVLDGDIINGASVNTAANKDITWEQSTEKNIGLDVGFFDNRLNIIAEYYDRYTDDILTTIPAPAPFGLSSPVQNVGAMSNKGFEFSVGYRNSLGKDFSYNASLNMSFNKNNVEKWPTPTKGDNIRKEGEAWNAFYGYKWIGFYQSEDEVANAPGTGTSVMVGDLKYEDINGDGKINADDRVVLGNSFPGTIYGLNLGAAFRNFDLSMLLQGVSNVSASVNRMVLLPFMNNSKANKDHLDYWTPENRNATYPGIREDSNSNNNHFSSYYVRDASYMRLKNIQVGYTLPEIPKVSKVRVYLSADNLLTFSNYWKNFDPETSTGVGSYPHVKTFSMGLKVDF